MRIKRFVAKFTTASAVLGLVMCCSSVRLGAQTPDEQPVYPLTLQQRMRRSVSRQLESVSRMQASVDRQRQVAQRQTGEPSPDADFFALPAPARLGPPLDLFRDLNADAVDDTAAEKKDDQPAEPDAGEKESIPPPGLMPYDPALLLPKAVSPIEGIPGLNAAPIAAPQKPKAVSPISSENLLKSIVTPALASPAPTAGPTSLEELLRSFVGQGAVPLPGLLRAQPQPGGNYSGLESAPLTSFSLTDWLFGL